MSAIRGGRMSAINNVPETAAAVPPAAVTGLMIMGVPVETWIQIGTLAYLAIAIAIALPKLFRMLSDVREKWRAWRARK